MNEPSEETPMATDPTTAPLDGIRVLELATMYAGPTAGRLLRDLGAEVIKVEDPRTGDGARGWVPQKDGVGLGFARLNGGKRFVAADLRTAAGQDLVRRLATEVDVVLESFRPGRLEAWGLGYEQLAEWNPRLVLARVSGFGQSGPYSGRPGFGTIAETMSGFAHVNGWPDTPPTAPPFGFADSIAGMAAALGVVSALHRRNQTGRGDVVDVALYEPLMFILGDAVLQWTANQQVMTRAGNATGAASPRGIYQASDGKWLAIAASAQRIAERLFAAIGRPDLKDDTRYATNAARLENDASLQRIIGDWIATRPRAEVLEILDAYEVVAAPVNDAQDIAADPHFLERTLRPVLGDVLGSALVPGAILRTGTWAGPAAYPEPKAIGADTEDVVSDLLGSAAAAD